jgi:hypothetical protein
VGGSTGPNFRMLGAADRGVALHGAAEGSSEDGRAGSRGTGSVTHGGRRLVFAWLVRPNAVWRRGRVFLVCDRCGRRCTRLYAPLATSGLACRSCWGLTYGSQTLYNYKNSLWGRGSIARMFGTTQREWAHDWAVERRAHRTEQSRKRWEERRPYLQRLIRPSGGTNGPDSY